MPQTPLLQMHDVSRVLGGRRVVDNVKFQLDRGSVLGLLGVNGAGKSTTLRMIAGVLAPTRGSVLIDGFDLREEPRRGGRQLGYLPERAPLYVEQRVHEYLDFCARLHGLRGKACVSAVASAIERCDLGEVRRRLLGNLSKGFQQRAGIAAAIVHAPALIVLDEPASGLDPVQTVQIRALVRELGRTHAVILSTHQLADVDSCCDRVAILHGGRLRHDGTMHDLTRGDGVRVVVSAAIDEAQWRTIDGVQSAVRDGSGWRVLLAPAATTAALAAAVVAKGWGLQELRAQDTPLEEVFLRIASADDAAQAADVAHAA